MNLTRLHILSFLACLALPAPLPAAVFKKAEVTRVLNDVRVVPDQASAVPARIGDVITGKTAVATGVSSRAELKFPDQTLTRLGANTLFRLEEGTRDIDLQQGVLLLQVPKQLGGARVRTAAVTAAVTGTTILVEYQPDGYIKIIVIEGEVDLFLRDKPSTFITIKAGDMIIMKPDARSFPLPVQVDLDRLIKTSKLFDPDEFGPVGNGVQINDALDRQNDRKNDGELLNTAFMLPGRGTQVTFTNEVRRELLRFQNPNPGRPGSSPNPNPSSPGSPDNPPNQTGPGSPPSAGPFIPGSTYITDNDLITTNPSVTAYNTLEFASITSEGFRYLPNRDGMPGSFIFGLPEVDSPLDFLIRTVGPWAGFYFEDLFLVGNPTVNTANGASNLLLAAENRIDLLGSSYYGDSFPRDGAPSGSGQLILDSSLRNFMLASNQGSILFEGYFQILGTNQNVILQTSGPDADIRISGYSPGFNHIDVPDGSFLASSSRDIQLSTAGINSSSVQLDAARDITVSHSTSVVAKSRTSLTAGRGVSITDSTLLRALSEVDPLQLSIQARGGDLTLLNSQIDAAEVKLESLVANLSLTNSVVSGDVIRARTLGPDGTLLINGTTFNAASALKLYAEGSNGQVRFSGNSSLNSPSATLAGKTVTIDPGVSVSVSSPANFRVYTDNAQFSNNSPNGYGAFTNDGAPFTVNQQGFGNRPGF